MLWELGLIFLVALLVFGPKQLPGLLKECQTLIQHVKHAYQQLANQVTLEANQAKAAEADAAYEKDDA